MPVYCQISRVCKAIHDKISGWMRKNSSLEGKGELWVLQINKEVGYLKFGLEDEEMGMYDRRWNDDTRRL